MVRMTKRVFIGVTVAVVGLLLTATTEGQSQPDLAGWFKAYDAAFTAKNLEALAKMYTTDTTVYEGGGINHGWIDYRDNHLGPELKSYDNLQFGHTNVEPHMLGPDGAYVTAEYSLKAKVGERAVDSGGLATYVLVKDQGVWKIRHTHTSAKRRAPGGH